MAAPSLGCYPFFQLNPPSGSARNVARYHLGLDGEARRPGSGGRSLLRADEPMTQSDLSRY